MEKYELEPSLKDEIRRRVFGEGFMKIVQSCRRGGKSFKIAMRPLDMGGERRFQAEMTDDGHVQAKNFDLAGAQAGLEEILAQKGAREIHVMTGAGDLHVRVTKKGHALVSRSAEMSRPVVLLPHDRVKATPLSQFDASALLRTIGLVDGDGRVRASRRGKYDQINEFLKAVGETLGPRPHEEGRPFTVVDCGCGKAYLTISLWFYLTEVLKIPDVRVIGVDRRHDVIAAAEKMASDLDLSDKVVFVEADLETFDLSTFPPFHSSTSPSHSSTLPPSHLSTFPPFHLSTIDMVVSLHACDTATDEALARGVEWGAHYILSAPCCQHELQKALRPDGAAGAFAGLLRQSILRERLCDILTDSFRAMILRILGFKVQVVEFVSSEATARNIMLRCVSGARSGQAGPVGEYLSLRDYWRVTPFLETRLSKILDKHLKRFEDA